MLGLDEKLNLSDAIATACSMLLPADGTLLERADAMLAML